MKQKILFVFASLCLTSTVFSQQIDTASTVVVEQNQEAELAYNQGITHLTNKEYTEAIAQFNEALKYNPRFTRAYINLGAAYTYAGDLRNAVISYNQALAIDSTLGQVHYSRGLLYYSQQMYEQSIKDFMSAQNKGYRTPELYYYLGVSYFFTKDYKTAIEAYTRAIAFNPKYAFAYNDRGSARR
ncbi:MAG TPA: tetratricopeptide repeat protein, partial [Bacteroidales bacterium]|nr:tetratricopeptide repeat protein [Bacteroidales bacterium]